MNENLTNFLAKEFSTYALQTKYIQQQLGIKNGVGICSECGSEEHLVNLRIVDTKLPTLPEDRNSFINYLTGFIDLKTKRIVCSCCTSEKGQQPLQNCCVYWIRSKHHSDFMTEGYIGVSGNFKERLNKHMYEAKHSRSKNKEFSAALLSGEFIASVLVVGSYAYCYSLENTLRPSWNIGWNIGVGGECPMVKHGLSSYKYFPAMLRMLSSCRESGFSIDPSLYTVDGKKSFLEYLDGIEGDGEFTLKDKSVGLVIGNVCRRSRTRIIRDSKKNILFKGELCSLQDLAEAYNIKPNTLLYRLRRGASIEQALGLSKKEIPTVVVNNTVIEYDGGITQADIFDAELLLLEGYNKNQIATKLGVPRRSLYSLLEKGGL